MWADHAPMEALRISDGTLSAAILPYGATLADLRHAEWARPLILGFPSLEDYVDAPHYCGAIVGRHANRIGGGKAFLGGRPLQLDCNVGTYHLHGGKTGLARQLWEIVEHRSDSLTLRVESPDGHEGYPGNLVVTAVYSLPEPGILRLQAEASSDRPTLVNLCHHAYFSFSTSGRVDDHLLEVAADRYLVTDGDLVPTGSIDDVSGTNLDFRAPRMFQASADRSPPVLNHTLCLAQAQRTVPTFAARVSTADGHTMELWTDQTALHVYDGYKLEEGLKGSGGRRFGPRSGFCLEAQNWTDAPRHAHFPSSELLPEATYRFQVDYRFGAPIYHPERILSKAVT